MSLCSKRDAKQVCKLNLETHHRHPCAAALVRKLQPQEPAEGHPIALV